MSTQKVDDAVKFAIEDIDDSLDDLADDDYIEALHQLEYWCKETRLKRAEQIRNAGGRA